MEWYVYAFDIALDRQFVVHKVDVRRIDPHSKFVRCCSEFFSSYLLCTGIVDVIAK